MNNHSDNRILSDETFSQGLAELLARDADLADIVAQWGKPPFWVHTPGFPGLVLAILSQQVSLESANAAINKLKNRLGSITPEEFLTLDDGALKKIGFSRQKASFVRGLAIDLKNVEFRLDELESMKDDQARERLMRVRGIGVWTADTYLLFSLRRSDAWPTGDLALAKAIQELRGLNTMPSWDEVDTIADQWRPWRAVAARILWHHYLNVRGRGSEA
jgi:DNA-3-methyladenine glycosylase II